MSLIFKALQRFDSPEVTQDEGHPEFPEKRNALTLRKLLLSPPLVIGAAAAIFLMGLAVSQVIHFFPGKMKQLTPTVQAATPDQAVAPKSAAKENFEVDIDTEPEIFPPASAQDVQKVSFQVHPPASDTPSAVKKPAAPERIRFQFVDSEDGMQEGGDSLQRVASSTMHSDALPSIEKKATLSPSIPIQKKDVSSADGVHPPSKVLSRVHYDAPSSLKLSETGGNVGGPPATVVSNPSNHSNENRQYQRQADQATKHLHVSQLANRIYGAIQADDVRLTAKLLAKLTRMKGADNLFVLKLRAFSLIRQDRLEEARGLLSNVLARSVDDLDAGLNMAAIDMKSGRLDSARRRLIQLQEIFPEDSNITLYLSKLPH